MIDLSYQAMGVVKVDGYPVFVEGALPGEQILFKLIKANKNFGYGRLEKIIQASPERVEVEEEIYSKTGSMPLQHMSYDAQLKFKRQQVISSMQRTAGLKDLDLGSTVGMAHPYAYRNKATIPVQEVDGQLQVGAYRQRSHELIPLEDFKIQEAEIDQAILTVRDILRHYQISAYDEVSLTGTLRHLVIRRGHYTGELMVVFVTNGQQLDHKHEIVEAIRNALPHTVSIIQNINSANTNVVLGPESQVLYGQDSYRDRMLGLEFDISHRSFFQVNTIQAEKLYQLALDYADLSPEDVVVDAYCGIGSISLALAQYAKKVYGIEIVSQAIDNAKVNARLNQLEESSQFECGPAEDILPRWAEEGFEADVLVVDPPRKGLDTDFMDASLTLAPRKIVYISCNPATQARDVNYLMAGGYQAVKAQPVDLFPQTTHIENIILLEKE